MIFSGTATALITPFRSNKVDYSALAKLIDFQLENNVDALVVLGTTGESATLTDDERLSVAKFVIRRVNGKIPVIVGSGSNCTQTAVGSSIVYEDVGADGLLLVTPYYNKCTQRGLAEHYLRIVEAVHIPVILYNVPSRTGVNLSAETFAHLAKQKNVVGLKEASGNLQQIAECIKFAGDDAVIYSGDDALTLPVISLGGKGVISVASNLYPREVSAMTAAALAGNYEDAKRIQLRLLPLISALFCEVNPIPVKMGAHILGYGDGNLRLPLTRLTEGNTKVLVDAMRELV